MIELMLEAERAMGVGLIDNAERLYAQVAAADPHNSIAITGLARVALERGDQRGAYLLARRALAIDPDNPVASHLARRMEEQLRMHGERVPADDAPNRAMPAAGSPEATGPDATGSPDATAAAMPESAMPESAAPGEAAPITAAPTTAAPPPTPIPDAPPVAPPSPGILGRFLRRRR